MSKGLYSNIQAFSKIFFNCVQKLFLYSVAGERYVYKFICDPRSLFSLAGFGGDNTAAALHYHAAAAAAISYPGMHPGHPLQPVR